MESSTCNLPKDAGQKLNLPEQQRRSYMPWQMQDQMLRRHYQMDVCHQLFPDC